MKDAAWSIGIDLGGTKIAAAFVGPGGEISHATVVPTNAGEGAQAIVDRIAALISDLRRSADKTPCSSVGIAVAGQVEAKTGTVFFAPNLDWHNFPLKAQLEKAVNLPVVVMNDVRAATYGEWLFGAGKGLQDFICLFVGTGIGGGVVTGGRLLEGKNNSAGELGHIVVDINGRQCSCGNHGCLESLASGWAIAKIAQELVLQRPNEGKALMSAVKGNLHALSAKEVCHLALEGDPLSLQIIDGVVEALTGGVVTLVNAFNPSHIILGGGFINGMPMIIERIAKPVKERGLKIATKNLSIVPVGLKVNAGVIGAAKFIGT